MNDSRLTISSPPNMAAKIRRKTWPSLAYAAISTKGQIQAESIQSVDKSFLYLILEDRFGSSTSAGTVQS